MCDSLIIIVVMMTQKYRGADKSLVRPGMKQATIMSKSS
jgi:hypothetical protein